MDLACTGGARQLLQGWTLERFLQRKPPSTVISVHDSDQLVEVLARFARSNIISAPVFTDDEGRFLGFIDLLDVVQALLGWFPARLDPDALAAHLKQAGQRLAATKVADVKLRGDAQMLYTAYLSASLLEAVREGFLRPAAAGRPCHRLAVFDYPDLAAADPLDAAAGLRITTIISQSDVVAFLQQHAAELGPALLGSSLESLGLKPKPVVCVPSDMPALHAFQAVLGSHVGCAGVVELHSHGALVAQVSTSDLRGMLPHHFELLRLPVAEFLARGLGAWEPPPTALTQSYGVKSPRRHTREVQLATCSMQSTLGEVLARVVEEHLHRLYVVDSAGRPLAILTLTDLLQLVAGVPPEE